MAEIRFNYGDKFTQTTDTNTGIGSTNPAAKLDIAGGTSAGSLRVSGIATLSSYQGFVNTKLSTTEDLIVEAGQSGSVSGEVVIGTGQTISVSTGATTGQGGIQSLKVFETFMPPVGGTADRPTDVKPGMVYYNKDFKTIEFWDGNFWKQVDNTTRRGRGVIGGGNPGSDNNAIIEFLQVSTLGNSINFGNLTVSRDCPGMGCVSDGTRGLFMGGWVSPTDTDVIDYITIASEGNAIDFGDTSNARGFSAACSSSTRGFNIGGYNPSTVNIIDYVEISTLGDALDFGDLDVVRESFSGMASPIRAITSGGMTPSIQSRIDVFTMSSKGNSVKFGDLTSLIRGNASVASQVRGIMAGGTGTPSGGTEKSFINYITIASDGNAITFGDLTRKARKPAGLSNATRGVFANGYIAPVFHNTMDFITIATTGNAQDFGETSEKCNGRGYCSDSHGGLGGF